MRMFVAALCCALLLAYGAASRAQENPAKESAPQQTADEELKYDDGTTEGQPVGQPSVIIVNRLTPTRYPATLKTIRVFFRQLTPSVVGKQIRLLAFARPASGTDNPRNPVYQVNQTVAVPPVSGNGEFVDFALTNGPTITSGDFFVGFQQPDEAGVPFFWSDSNTPLANRGYASTDNGVTYQGNLQLTGGSSFINFMIRALVTIPAVGPLATVSAASFATDGLAPETIGAAFGSNLATGTTVATSVPLPTTLGGVSVRVRDSNNVERLAPLFFVGIGQINYLIPAGTANGQALVTVSNAGGPVASGPLAIATVAPGLFTFEANGRGYAAGYALRVPASGPQSAAFFARLDSATNRYVANPIDFGAATDRTFCIFFGTGIRGRSALANAQAFIGGTRLAVDYASAQGDLVGLDQVNIEVPRSLAGRGDLDLFLTVDGKLANTVRVNFK
ncbi:MAG: hypothetical protein HYR56_10855 [Acidobacteria bacterium]|nr:hypothetical protein [Acidobacteriota bacterium]MBI3424954.1 hypothetical protein [Acidobacteriota bacterium]